MSVIGSLFGVTPEPWQEQALCAQIGGDLWHAERGEVRKVREAKKICASCPVRIACADGGVRVDDPYAILGGPSSRDRRRLKRGERVVFKPPKTKPRKPPQRCLYCGALVEGQHFNVKFCSDNCRAQNHRERQNEKRRLQRLALREEAA